MRKPQELKAGVSRVVRVSFANLKLGVPKKRILTSTFAHFLDNELAASAAGISYFLLLVMFPFLLITFDLGNHFPRLGELNRYAIETVSALFPRGIRGIVVDYLRAIAHPSNGALVTCAVIILWAGSWAFSIIEKALNRIWRTEPRSFLRGRWISLLMMTSVGLLLGLSATINGVLAFLQTSADQLSGKVPQASILMASHLWQVVFGVVGLLLTISLFALVYIVMPTTRVTLVEALPGAVIAGATWEVARYLFAWVLSEMPYDQLYGSLAAVVATLTWIYISNLLMLFGAQMTALFHCEYLIDKRCPEQSIESRRITAAASSHR